VALPGRSVETDDRLGECHYGAWTGRPLAEAAKEDLWRVVQDDPAAAAFPPHDRFAAESLAEMADRVIGGVRALDADVEAEHGKDAVWLAVSHGDLIKSVLADALGMHLDLFQRIQVDPASISVIRYTDARPYVLASNTHEGDLSWLVPQPKGPKSPKSPKSRARKGARRAADPGAAVGGGAGPA